jgi:pimeloyl-ACP methyl ester carboxylesterase
MIDRGNGFPIVLIPGIQGRWEWMSPAIEALSDRHRVLSFSLDEGLQPSSREAAFDAWVADIDAMLDEARLPHAAITGVSFGGLIAAYYAAARPERTSSLVLVSAPSPEMPIDDTTALYMRHPRLALPAFAARASKRILPEIMAARHRWSSRLEFAMEYFGRAMRFPVSPKRMVAWVEAWQATDIASACRRVTAPTLVVTGEAELDRVVPVHQTLKYLDLIGGATHKRFERTGHVGFASRSQEFASLVAPFVDAHRPARTISTDAEADRVPVIG